MPAALACEVKETLKLSNEFTLVTADSLATVIISEAEFWNFKKEKPKMRIILVYFE